MSGLLSREDILKADDLKTRDVDVPEWLSSSGAQTVRVRELTGTDVDAYQESLRETLEDGTVVVSQANARAKLLVRAIVGADGEPMFNELDIGQLGRKSSVALERVYKAAMELSAFSERAVQDAEGKSGPDLSSGSISG